jgi:MFS family permease
MVRELIEKVGWTRAVQYTATLTSVTALFSAISAQPNPKHPLNKGDNHKWLSVRRWIDPPAFKFSPFLWFSASIALMFFGFYAVFFNLEEWALHSQLGRTNERGPPDHQVPVFYYLATMNGASTIGRVLSGWLSDKFGALHVHFVVMFISSLLLLAMWTTVNNVAGAFAFVILFGAFSGAVIGMPPATIAHIIQYAPDTDHSRMGHWTGMMYTIAAPFALVGPVIAGHLITRFGMNFLTVQLWSGFCLFLSSMCIAAGMYCMHRQNLRVQRVRSFARSIFEGETGSVFRAGSLFRSGQETAVPSAYVSDNEEKEDKNSPRRPS